MKRLIQRRNIQQDANSSTENFGDNYFLRIGPMSMLASFLGWKDTKALD
jgi:hypothetical protein